MAKNPRFDYRKTSKGWLLNVPGSVSDTGRKRRRYFKTRDAAKAEAQRLREVFNGNREKATDIPPALAEDATRAAEALAGYGVSLVQAVAFFVSHHDARNQAPTLDQAWEEAIKRRPNHRPRTIADFRSWRNSLPDWFLALNILDIDPANIGQALHETTPGATRWRSGLRYVSAVLGDQVKAGTLADNPAKRVHVPRKADEDGEVSIYTAEEIKALMSACRDYEEGRDKECAPCAIPFAMMGFAGIRPDEVTKLRWEDVSLELANIRIGPTVAKKARRRNVRINSTLAAWLSTVPTEKRKGKLIPPRWRYRAARVRREAGIDALEKQDALRHSFGTYSLAKDNDIDALKADMGHEHVGVFLNHYYKAVTKRESLEYWQVLPEGAKLPNIAAA